MACTCLDRIFWIQQAEEQPQRPGAFNPQLHFESNRGGLWDGRSWSGSWWFRLSCFLCRWACNSWDFSILNRINFDSHRLDRFCHVNVTVAIFVRRLPVSSWVADSSHLISATPIQSCYLQNVDSSKVQLTDWQFSCLPAKTWIPCVEQTSTLSETGLWVVNLKS